jgi:hypothetical protein
MFPPQPELHDATLRSVTMEWDAGVVVLRIDTDEGHHALHALDATILSVPRGGTWGRSVSINTAQYAHTDAGTVLRLEMQSGDTIVVAARSFEWRAST